MIDARDVTAVIPTRGDVDMTRILDSLVFRNVLVYDNARLPDVGAFGRYVAASAALTDYVYTQDDDCIVAPHVQLELLREYEPGELLSNMDPGHNGSAMPLLALPGWGAIFSRQALLDARAAWAAALLEEDYSDDFLRVGCDIVYPVLMPSRMIDLGHENLPYAWDSHRTNLQPGYAEKKAWYYRRAAELRR